MEKENRYIRDYPFPKEEESFLTYFENFLPRLEGIKDQIATMVKDR